jgi:hypothetical protein
MSEDLKLMEPKYDGTMYNGRSLCLIYSSYDDIADAQCRTYTAGRFPHYELAYAIIIIEASWLMAMDINVRRNAPP